MAACADPAGPNGEPPAPPLRLTITRPSGDTLPGLGFDFAAAFSDTTAHTLRLYVDSGTAAERVTTWRFASVLTLPSYLLHGVAMTSGPGRHTFVFVAGDTAARPLATARAAYTVAVDDAPYAAAALPDLGAGGGARGIASTGAVAGYVLTAAGRKRPAVWRDGALTVLPVSDSADVVAAGTNAAGDVLLQSYRPGAVTTHNAGARAARVWRADGTLLTIGPLLTNLGGATAEFCCTLAADLNDRRQALGTTTTTASFDRSAVFDVVRGAVVDSTATRLLVLDNAGRAAGHRQYDYTPGVYLATYGFSEPLLPSTGYEALVRPDCGFSRGAPIYNDTPLGLGDDGSLLVDRCRGNALLVPAAGAPRYVDRMVGAGRQVRMARDGGLVAALDSTGALYLWRTAGRRVTRARVAGAWRLDSLAGVNAAGAIAAYGVNTATGRGGALRLTPAP